MKEIYRTTLGLRWGDMDSIGHVNNTVYFRFFEQARVEWLDRFPQEIDGNPAYVVIVHAECSFLKELKAPGSVEIRVLAGEMGRSSLVQHYELSRSDSPDTLAATGSAKMVWVDPATGRSTPVPDRFKAAL
ncbi:MAG TPA: thioesterase family protein [Limnobacter sp.]|nr:thioesterase family protein [Limnobacter sp.]